MEKYSKVYIKLFKLSPFAHLSQSIYVYFMWQNIHTFISNCSNYLPLFIYYSPFMRNKYISYGKIYFFQIISLIHLLHRPIIEKSIGLSKKNSNYLPLPQCNFHHFGIIFHWLSRHCRLLTFICHFCCTHFINIFNEHSSLNRLYAVASSSWSLLICKSPRSLFIACILSFRPLFSFF